MNVRATPATMADDVWTILMDTLVPVGLDLQAKIVKLILMNVKVILAELEDNV